MRALLITLVMLASTFGADMVRASVSFNGIGAEGWYSVSQGVLYQDNGKRRYVDTRDGAVVSAPTQPYTTQPPAKKLFKRQPDVPYCKVVVSMGQDPDGKARADSVVYGWYDNDTTIVYDNTPLLFGDAVYTHERIVSWAPVAAPNTMPARIRHLLDIKAIEWDPPQPKAEK